MFQGCVVSTLMELWDESDCLKMLKKCFTQKSLIFTSAPRKSFVFLSSHEDLTPSLTVASDIFRLMFIMRENCSGDLVLKDKQNH